MKTPEEINRLQNEFNSIYDVDQKIEFFKNKLEFEYFDMNLKIQDNQWLLDFTIRPNGAKQIEKLNEYYLECVEQRYLYALIDLNKLKNDFEIRLSTVTNKVAFINDELLRVKKLAEPQIISFSTKSSNQKSTYHCKEYDDMLYHNIEIDFTRQVISPNRMIQALNGQTWAKYHLYLNNLLNPKKEISKHALTHIEQMLILDYLGVGKELTNKNKAKLYEPIINRDFETTRQYFSKLNFEKRNANLQIIKKLFEEIGYEKQSEMVQNDIDKYHKKRK